MAYGEYANAERSFGKCLYQLSRIGIPLRFVESVTFSDVGVLTLHNRPFATFVWDGETGIPVFTFASEFRQYEELQTNFMLRNGSLHTKTVRHYFIREGDQVRRGVTEEEYKHLREDCGLPFNSAPFEVTLNSNRITGSFEDFPAYRLPKLVAMDNIPAESNPFHYDSYNMGCSVSGAWTAMYDQHAGLDRRKTEELGVPVWYEDPKYIIFVNSRTGQRFKLDFTAIEKRTCIYCTYCGAELVEGNDGLYHDNKPDLSQYCYADPVAGSRLHDPISEVQLTAEQLTQYNELRKSGKTHWEALGLIYGEIDP